MYAISLLDSQTLSRIKIYLQFLDMCCYAEILNCVGVVYIWENPEYPKTPPLLSGMATTYPTGIEPGRQVEKRVHQPLR